jgi:hypothetical protein
VIEADGQAAVVAELPQVGCRRLFRGEEWIDPASLENAVLCALDEWDGLLLAGLTINGDANQWAVFSRVMQTGFFLHSGLAPASNLLRYADDLGRDVVLMGDAAGRLWRLLVRGVLSDPNSADVATPYTSRYRGGWDESRVVRGAGEKLRYVAAQRIAIESAVLPTPSAVDIDYSLWRMDHPVRHPSDVTAAHTATGAIGPRAIMTDIPLALGARRFHSLELSFDSTAGASASGGRPLELTRWRLVFDDERPVA